MHLSRFRLVCLAAAAASSALLVGCGTTPSTPVNPVFDPGARADHAEAFADLGAETIKKGIQLPKALAGCAALIG